MTNFVMTDVQRIYVSEQSDHFAPEEQRTPAICLAAVQKNGHAVQYLTPEERSPTICLAAVNENEHAVQYLTPEQRTPAICLAAVQQDGHNVRRFAWWQQSSGVCLAAVRQCGHAVMFLISEKRSPAVCLAAVQENGYAVQHLTPEQRTPAICRAAVRESAWAIRMFAPEQRTLAVCLVAVQQTAEWRPAALGAVQSTKVEWPAEWGIEADYLSANEMFECAKWTPELHCYFSDRTQCSVEIFFVISSAILPLEVAMGVTRRIPSDPPRVVRMDDSMNDPMD